MKKVGGYLRRQPGSMKEVQQMLLDEFGGAPGAAEALLHMVSQTQLNRYTSEPKKDDPPANMPLHIVDALEALCGKAVVTEWLAHRRNAILVPLSKGKPEAYLKHLCEIGRANGLVFKEAQDALRDGVMTPKEAGKVKRQLMELATAVAWMISRCDRVIESGQADT